jgi:3'(2'), 5'-bisphosphate nucleotidase
MITEISELLHATKEASREVLKIFEAHNFKIFKKQDQSPVTTADLLSEQILTGALKDLYPGDLIISEEGNPELLETKARKAKGFWLVDPLDGTKEFIAGRQEFAINIAYIEHQKPVLGIMADPCRNIIYCAKKGQGCWKIENKNWSKINTCPPAHTDKLKILTSRSHLSHDEALFQKMSTRYDFVVLGSSLKFASIAAGQAHLYHRRTPTYEWDTAAGHALINEAGGILTTLGGAPLMYGKKKFLNSGILAGHPDTISKFRSQK